jgi:hypothetical protein
MSNRTLSSLFVILAVIAGVEGCSSSTDGTGGQTSSGGSPSTSGSPSSSSLAGAYSGTYQGDAKGTVSMTITGQTIDVIANVAGKNYAASGAVTGAGGVSVGIGTGDGVTVTFEGTFTSAGGSGTWTSSVATHGTWSVAK